MILTYTVLYATILSDLRFSPDSGLGEDQTSSDIK